MACFWRGLVGRFCIEVNAGNFPVLNNSRLSSVLVRSFKSIYSLDKLYPKSSLDIAKTPEIPDTTQEKFSGYIPINELNIKHSRSSGPGGQHVNKVNSKVDVRFHVSSATWLSNRTKEKFADMHKHNITKSGYFIVKSEKTKSQLLNTADCLDKIRCYIREVEKEPPVVPPETKALLKARLDLANSERLRQKRIRSNRKREGQFDPFKFM